MTLDVSILVHAGRVAWHVEDLLESSTEFALQNLDLRAVQQRGFVNLRGQLSDSCTDNKLNMTLRVDVGGNKPEQSVMLDAFRANFNVWDVPEILASPCCSQIGVTRELIRSVPKEQYEHHINWLLNTPLSDRLSGRVWEHLWHYLFLRKTQECPSEYTTYCQLYHICFDGPEDYADFAGLHKTREKLAKDLNVLKDKSSSHTDKHRGQSIENSTNDTRQKVQEEIAAIDNEMKARREVAMLRGKIEANRYMTKEQIYDVADVVPDMS